MRTSMVGRVVVCSAGLLVGLATGVGCWGFASSHCGNQAGDETCVERGAGGYCDLCRVANDGCTNVPPAGECVAAGVGESQTAEAGGDTVAEAGGDTVVGDASGVATANVDGGASDEAGGTTGAECTSDGDCGGNEPICDAGGRCVACSTHAQCGEAACNFFTGACLSERIVHVGPGREFGDLEAAVGSFNELNGLEGTIIVHARDGEYKDTVVVDGGRTLAFLAFEDERPAWNKRQGNTSPLHVSGPGSTVLTDFMKLQGSSPDAPGVHVTNGGRAWMDRTRIVENEGGGVLADAGAEIVLRNCFVGYGRDLEDFLDVDDPNALEIQDASATVLYTTLGAGFVDATALACTNPISVVVRNSIIVAQGLPDLPAGAAVDVACDGVDITQTATESFVPGTGNVELEQMLVPSTWFTGYANGDFHLQDEGIALFAGIAQRQADDPPTDIDGDLRPTVVGEPDYAGADLPTL